MAKEEGAATREILSDLACYDGKASKFSDYEMLLQSIASYEACSNVSSFNKCFPEIAAYICKEYSWELFERVYIVAETNGSGDDLQVHHPLWTALKEVVSSLTQHNRPGEMYLMAMEKLDGCQTVTGFEVLMYALHLCVARATQQADRKYFLQNGLSLVLGHLRETFTEGSVNTQKALVHSTTQWYTDMLAMLMSLASTQELSSMAYLQCSYLLANFAFQLCSCIGTHCEIPDSRFMMIQQIATVLYGQKALDLEGIVFDYPKFVKMRVFQQERAAHAPKKTIGVRAPTQVYKGHHSYTQLPYMPHRCVPWTALTARKDDHYSETYRRVYQGKWSLLVEMNICLDLLGLALVVHALLTRAIGQSASSVAACFPCVYSESHMYNHLKVYIILLLNHAQVQATEGLQMLTIWDTLCIGKTLPTPWDSSNFSHKSRFGQFSSVVSAECLGKLPTWYMPLIVDATQADVMQTMHSDAQNSLFSWQVLGDKCLSKEYDASSIAAELYRGVLACVDALDAFGVYDAALSALVACPQDMLRNQAVAAMRRSLRCFEEWSLFQLLTHLVGSCGHGYAKAIIIDLFKECCQSSWKGGYWGRPPPTAPTPSSADETRALRDCEWQANFFARCQFAWRDIFDTPVDSLLLREGGPTEGGQVTAPATMLREAGNTQYVAALATSISNAPFLKFATWSAIDIEILWDTVHSPGFPHAASTLCSPFVSPLLPTALSISPTLRYFRTAVKELSADITEDTRWAQLVDQIDVVGALVNLLQLVCLRFTQKTTSPTDCTCPQALYFANWVDGSHSSGSQVKGAIGELLKINMHINALAHELASLALQPEFQRMLHSSSAINSREALKLELLQCNIQHLQSSLRTVSAQMLESLLPHMLLAA